MVFRTQFTNAQRQAAFTLVEMLFTVGVAAVILAAVLSFLAFSNRSFASLTNYLDLDQKTQLAVDKMSREIRQVLQLTGFNSTNLTFQDYDGGTLAYNYDANQQIVTRTKGSTTETLLTGCDSLTFNIFQRNPSNGTFQPYSTSTISETKLVELTWNCSRTIFGSKVNTECMQSAKVAIRIK
jgi:Tfp pilus assembly protein PilW